MLGLISSIAFAIYTAPFGRVDFIKNGRTIERGGMEVAEASVTLSHDEMASSQQPDLMSFFSSCHDLTGTCEPLLGTCRGLVELHRDHWITGSPS